MTKNQETWGAFKPLRIKPFNLANAGLNEANHVGNVYSGYKYISALSSTCTQLIKKIA